MSLYPPRRHFSNDRLVAIEDGKGNFAGRTIGTAVGKRLAVAGDEFIRRFLLHVLPEASILSATTTFSAITIARKSSPTAATCSACRLPSRRMAHPKVLGPLQGSHQSLPQAMTGQSRRLGDHHRNHLRRATGPPPRLNAHWGHPLRRLGSNPNRFPLL
ncbi:MULTISPECIES: transposase [unclassified Mesorhizobium]|uniref:transposase n=1 Tax=unclassified Mesorhizobium TaxID=325217 RepID=UPI00333C983E